MIGASIRHKNAVFTVHTTLPREQSAIVTATKNQKIAAGITASLILMSLAIMPVQTMIALLAILSLVYFSDMVFHFTSIIRSLIHNPEIKIPQTEIRQLKDDDLPTYTVLCPLYKEANVLPDFVNAVSHLDWPKDKLEVLLLLEEDDFETIYVAQSSDLPPFVKTVIIPDSQPRTKPKACNYGLGLATGRYLVVYDAEDRPEPFQLKKAYLAFRRVDSSVKCLQAKLNYYNPGQNLLTRLFTAEYSLWFDLILPGLQSMNTYIPLGGTSNHFRTWDLRHLKGWDPFNVTEDCDLGARIFRLGYRTAVFDSTTYEEANSNVRNWIKQRSRWIKGYMQTYLVHMRKPLDFYREKGKEALVFQLVVGCRIMFLFLNPVLWLMTAGYFLMRGTLGPTIESFYPSIVFYFAAASLVAGNFLNIYYYMVGLARRNQWGLIKYVYLVPFYWILASIAALVAVYQLIFKPHYWEKTEHGLTVRSRSYDLSLQT